MDSPKRASSLETALPKGHNGQAGLPSNRGFGSVNYCKRLDTLRDSVVGTA